MFVLICRVIIIYLVVLLFLRIMGKRQLGEMQPFELVITLLIADIASLPMTQTSMPILFSLVPLATLVIVHFFVCLLSRKSIFMRKIINGKPVIVVSPEGVQLQALKELNMSMDDLMEGVRGCNYFSLEDVLYAIVETNGTVTVIPKKQSSAVTVEDMKLEGVQENVLPLILVSAGKVVKKNLDITGKDENFLHEILSKANLKDLSEILLLTIDVEGAVFVETVSGQRQNLNIEFEGRW